MAKIRIILVRVTLAVFGLLSFCFLFFDRFNIDDYSRSLAESEYRGVLVNQLEFEFEVKTGRNPLDFKTGWIERVQVPYFNSSFPGSKDDPKGCCYICIPISQNDIQLLKSDDLAIQPKAEFHGLDLSPSRNHLLFIMVSREVAKSRKLTMHYSRLQDSADIDVSW